MTEDFRKNLSRLAQDIELRSRRARDAHFLAARRWDSANLWLGLSAVLAGVVGGGSAGAGFFPNVSSAALAAWFAAIAGLLAAAASFLRPSDRIEAHKRAGDNWAILRDRAARFHALELARTDLNDRQLQESYDALLALKEEITRNSPVIPTWAYDRASKKTYPPTIPPR